MKKNSIALLLSTALTLSLTACGNQPAANPTPTPAGEPSQNAQLQLGMAYGSPNGTGSFGHAYAAVNGDVIVAAFIDEFQFMDNTLGLTYVPNSDAAFADGYAEGQALASKRNVTDYYSGLMADYAGSTVSIDENYNAIQAFAVGKTIREIEELANGDATAAVDSVSGATLVGTANYLGMIAQAAKNAQSEESVEYSGDTSTLKLNVVYGAAHGTKCFSVGAALTNHDTIVLSYLDEFQFMDNTLGLTYVPNSDGDFAAGYAEGVALASKRTVADYYSSMMAENGNATVRIDDNFDAIQSYTRGKTVSELTTLAEADKSTATDAVTGATLADTAGYIALIATAAAQ